MTLENFSDGMSTLLNSHGVGDQIVLDEYEKSFFLTKAEQDIALSLYDGKNVSGDSFEKSEELRRWFSNLIGEETLEPMTEGVDGLIGVEEYSEFFQLPDDLDFITYESVTSVKSCGKKLLTQDVYPVTQDEYHRTKRNPFRGANDRRALRLDLSDNVVEVVSIYPIHSYYIRYIKKLEPIILRDLPEGMEIMGKSWAMNCQLHESLHQKILDRAVELAIQSRGKVRKE